MLFFSESEAREFYYGNTCKMMSRKEAPRHIQLISSEEVFHIPKAGTTEATNQIELPEDSLTESTVITPAHSTSNIELKKLPKRLTNAREAFGLTQQQAANLIGVSLSTLQKTEAGEVSPNRETAFKYMDFIILEKILKKNLNQAFLRRTILTIPSVLYGNLSAIDYAKKLFPNGMKPVLASFRKSYE